MKQINNKHTVKTDVYTIVNEDGETVIKVKPTRKCQVIKGALMNALPGLEPKRSKVLELQVTDKKYTQNSKSFGKLAHDVWNIVDSIPDDKIELRPDSPLKPETPALGLLEITVNAVTSKPNNLTAFNIKRDKIKAILTQALEKINRL